MPTESKQFSILKANTGILLFIDVDWEEKYELKKIGFCLKSEIRAPLNKRGGIVGIFLLLKKLFIMDQYNLADVFGLSNVTLRLSGIYLWYQ